MDLINHLINIVKNNEVFSGVALGSALTSTLIAFLYSLKDSPKIFFKIIKRFTTVKLIINNKDPEYRNILIWIQQFSKHNLRSYNFNSLTQYITHDDENNSDDYVLSPGIGNHYFWYKKRLIRISIQQHYQNADGVIEIIEIKCFAFTNKIIKQIYEEILSIALMKDSLKIYVLEDNNFWRKKIRYKRTINNFIYKDKEKVINNVQEFFNKKQWYIDKGLLHKKGILLSGPPGTGKSTFASVIASELDLNLYYLNLSNSETIRKLDTIISEVPKNSIILLEDIDCLFMTKDREKVENNKYLSTLLNILDGVNSPTGIIYILTTNYINRIDKAILRPGRIDMYIKMDYFNKDEIFEMYSIYYDNGFDEFWKLIIDNNIDYSKISPACFQNIFTCFSEAQELNLAIKTDSQKFIQEYIR